MPSKTQKTTLQKGQFERLVQKAKQLEKRIGSCVQSHQKLVAQIQKNRPCVVECKKKNVQRARKAEIPRGRTSIAQQVDRIKRERQRNQRRQTKNQ